MGTMLEFIWVISSFLSFLIFIVMFLHSIMKKTSRGFYMTVNLLIQQVVCATLKKYIAQARPIGACSTSFGYPSGHSGFAASLATWLILEMILLHNAVPFKATKLYSLMRNSFVIFAPLIPISRYHLNYHSSGQIMCGLLVGFLCTMIYFNTVVRSLKPKKDRPTNSFVVTMWKKYNFHHNFDLHFSECSLKAIN